LKTWTWRCCFLLPAAAGVEQATNSVALQSYCFPKLCVLLLGNEQNGIPVSLLPLLDVCVEIPMLGVTRSLNAHVSGAMVVWQYTQQHLPQPGC
jgi:tRNA G18 (ribose-2'-O)-methylase SpoU